MFLFTSLNVVKENGDFEVTLCTGGHHNGSGDFTTAPYKRGKLVTMQRTLILLCCFMILDAMLHMTRFK